MDRKLKAHISAESPPKMRTPIRTMASTLMDTGMLSYKFYDFKGIFMYFSALKWGVLPKN